MLCAVDGEGPQIEETENWECLMKELVSITKVPGLDGEIRKVQIYGKARPSPMDPKTTALPVKYLEDRAGFLRLMLETLPCKTPPVEVYP
jgi:histidinol dehydrogenase